ncbi:MAG: hypothetical protein FE78DRAFT_307612 [Acidomyces sp. 'richmondensis']|nr:MAG: hypothetical protein FE78DRAFT_307612 [Acidomyces sp. 'richmondensis']
MPENVRKVFAKLRTHGIKPTVLLENNGRAQHSWLRTKLYRSLMAAVGRLGSHWEKKSPRQRARWWAAMATKELKRLIQNPPQAQQNYVVPTKRASTKVAGRSLSQRIATGSIRSRKQVARITGRKKYLDCGVRLRWTLSAPPTIVRRVEPQTSGLGTRRRRRMEKMEGYFAKKLTNMLRERARRKLDSEKIWQSLYSSMGDSGWKGENARSTCADSRNQNFPTLTGRGKEDLILNVRAWLRRARTY